MSYMINLFIILIIAIVISNLFKKKIEQTVPITVMGIIFILYVFGIVNKLKLGLYVIYVITVISLIYEIILLFIKRNNIKEELFKIFSPRNMHLCIYLYNIYFAK